MSLRVKISSRAGADLAHQLRWCFRGSLYHFAVKVLVNRQAGEVAFEDEAGESAQRGRLEV